MWKMLLFGGITLAAQGVACSQLIIWESLVWMCDRRCVCMVVGDAEAWW